MLKFLSYRLQPEELELQFRREMLPQNKIQAYLMLGFVVLVLTGSALNDLVFMESSLLVLGTAASRLTTMVIFLSGLWILRFQNQVHIFDRIMTVLVFAIVANMIIVDFLMSNDYVTIPVWDMIAIVLVYMALPMHLYLQILMIVPFTIFSAITWLMFKAPTWTSLETSSTISAYITINVLGIFVSYRNNSMRRQQFVLLQNELAAKNKLEKAMNEVNQLRGIIPICASCKNVRDSKGYWKQVEAYIEDHSEAEFSHGLCEDCADRLYGDKEWYQNRFSDKQTS